MPRRIAYLIAIAFVGAFSVTVCFGQSGTGGSSPFQSYGGGPFDRVNLSSLNIHYDIPVFSKAGRRLPFFYMLVTCSPKSAQN